jgi:hypothetical protein
MIHEDVYPDLCLIFGFLIQDHGLDLWLLRTLALLPFFRLLYVYPAIPGVFCMGEEAKSTREELCMLFSFAYPIPSYYFCDSLALALAWRILRVFSFLPSLRYPGYFMLYHWRASWVEASSCIASG